MENLALFALTGIGFGIHQCATCFDTDCHHHTDCSFNPRPDFTPLPIDTEVRNLASRVGEGRLMFRFYRLFILGFDPIANITQPNSTTSPIVYH